MGFLGDLGVQGAEGVGEGLKGVGQKVGIVLLIFFVVVLAGIITFVYYSKKLKKQQFRYQIHIFKDIAGELQPIDNDVAKEVFVPDTNVGLYYLQNKKIYIARPTRAMGKNAFWYKILANGEWVNFDLKSVKGKDTLSEADYDHRDTRYAYINLKEIIKRNYRDKSVKWWKEYAPIITFIVIAFVFILGCWVLLAKIGKLIETASLLVETSKGLQSSSAELIQTATNINSGIIQT